VRPFGCCLKKLHAARELAIRLREPLDQARPLQMLALSFMTYVKDGGRDCQ